MPEGQMQSMCSLTDKKKKSCGALKFQYDAELYFIHLFKLLKG